MRVCAINFLRTQNYALANKKVKRFNNIPQESEAQKTAFKGKTTGVGGTVGCVVGTAAGFGAGVLLTVVTGGAAAPLIAACAGCYLGGIGGEYVESKMN